MRHALDPEGLRASLGQQIGLSDWVRLDQSRIQAFADVTEDRQAIHLDADAGRAAGFDGSVAHGFLTLAMLSALSYDALPVITGQQASINYGFDKLRFISPVPGGSEIRARFVLEKIETRDNGMLMLVLAVRVEIQGQERPAISAVWRVLYTF